jgi:hypothetical protein
MKEMAYGFLVVTLFKTAWPHRHIHLLQLEFATAKWNKILKLAPRNTML